MDKWREQFEEWFESSGMTKFKETAWAAWQASREALVVDLPTEDDTRCDTSRDEARQGSYNHAIGECRAAIEAQGVKCK